MYARAARMSGTKTVGLTAWPRVCRSGLGAPAHWPLVKPVRGLCFSPPSVKHGAISCRALTTRATCASGQLAMTHERRRVVSPGVQLLGRSSPSSDAPRLISRMLRNRLTRVLACTCPRD